MFAGVLDFLNGNAWMGVVFVLSVMYFLAMLGFQWDRCQAEHPEHGQCRLALRHRPRRKHRTFSGKEWYS